MNATLAIDSPINSFPTFEETASSLAHNTQLIFKATTTLAIQAAYQSLEENESDFLPNPVDVEAILTLHKKETLKGKARRPKR